MSKIIAIIPARSGSKSIKDKNLQIVSDKNLIEWAVKICEESKLISEFYISTDSLRYKGILENLGIKVPYQRPKKFAKDTSSDYEMILDFLLWYKKNKKILPDYLVHLRPTTPLRSVKIVDKAIKALQKSKKKTSLRSVHKMSETSYKTFEINKKGQLCSVFEKNPNIDGSNNSRQSYPQTYAANGYVDILLPKELIKNNYLHGDNCMPYLTPYTLEVDSHFELNMIKLLAESNKKK